MDVRRVVTAHDEAGRSVFASDERVAPVTLSMLPGHEFHRLWGADVTPTVPTDGTEPRAHAYFPPAGGFRFGLFTLGPASSAVAADVDLAAGVRELQEKLPGMLEVSEPEHPGMHTTDTVDFDVVLSGEVWLELDDGAETRLRAGDCVVQNGTRHAWHNRAEEPAVLAVAIVGARRTS